MFVNTVLNIFVIQHLESRSKAKYNRVSLAMRGFAMFEEQSGCNCMESPRNICSFCNRWNINLRNSGILVSQEVFEKLNVKGSLVQWHRLTSIRIQERFDQKLEVEGERSIPSSVTHLTSIRRGEKTNSVSSFIFHVPIRRSYVLR